jgi:nitroreductase
MTNETLHTIESLRTIHWDFNDKPVSREDVEKIIGYSMRAANSDNLIDYSVIVVDDPELLNEISGGESMGKAVTCLIYAIDHTRIIKCAQELGYNQFHPNRRFYNFFISYYDVCAAAQTAVITAKSMGIDSLTTNFIHRQFPSKVMEKLNLPKKYCFPVIQVVLGYSDKDPSKTRGRISKEHIVHYNTYRPEETINTKAIITELDAIYPEYQTEQFKHAMDWYFCEWLKDWYSEEVHQDLENTLVQSELI